jgi:hypothetical protein
MSFVKDVLDPGDLVGGLSGKNAAEAAGNAAELQTQAANHAADLQNEQFQAFMKNLAPYQQLGTDTIPQLMQMLNGGSLTQGFSFDPSDLENTPGYQFTLNQGLKGLANSASAKGLGLSGAQLKGMQDYTTGLAQNTYNQQYQNALNSYTTNYGVKNDQFNRLSGLLGLGQNAAAGVGNAGMQTASKVGDLMTQGANAGASGLIGAANAQTQGTNNMLSLGIGLASMLSDARMKHSIQHIGRTPGGNNWYRFSYLGSNEVHEGVMAQEIEQTNPDAVQEVGGIKYVDYSKVN